MGYESDLGGREAGSEGGRGGQERGIWGRGGRQTGKRGAGRSLDCGGPSRNISDSIPFTPLKVPTSHFHCSHFHFQHMDLDLLNSVAPPPAPKGFFSRLLCLGTPSLKSPELVEEQVGHGCISNTSFGHTLVNMSSPSLPASFPNRPPHITHCRRDCSPSPGHLSASLTPCT